MTFISDNASLRLTDRVLLPAPQARNRQQPIYREHAHEFRDAHADD